jgi:hypothetical protein
MKRIELEARTIFAQVAENVWSDPLVYGSFSRKMVKGKPFLYQGYSVEGKQVQTYLGEATDELMAQVAGWKELNRQLQRLTAMATKGGCLTVDRLTEAVVMRFAERGRFRAGGVLVGSHAFAVIGNVLGPAWSAEAIRTREGNLDDFVFVHPQTGKAYQHQTLDKFFREARDALGYPEATLEVFGRHSWVTQRLDEGWTYTDISHYTLNDASTLQKFYANVTKATRRSISKISKQREVGNQPLAVG